MNTIKSKIELIIDELKSVLLNHEIKHCEDFIEEIKSARKIVTCGAGRVGYAIKAFTMRLGHFGFNAFHIGDSTVPRINDKDLFIVASGSGETKTILDLTQIAKKTNSRIIAITGNEKSSIAKIADIVIKISAPTKDSNKQASLQPMTTLNEQSLFLFFDALVLLMMDVLVLKNEDLSAYHSILE
jgi:6-phospho-3-hexuloisomerase